MSGTRVVLVLVLVLAAFAHALWNVAAKRVGGGGVPFVWLCQTAAAVSTLPVAAATAAGSDVRPRWSWLLAVAVTAVTHVAYHLVVQRGYEVGDLSVVYPVARGGAPLLSVLVAVLVLGERPGGPALVGAGTVVAGVLLIGLTPQRSRDGSVLRGVCHGGLAAATIAGYTLWDAHAVTALAVVPPLYLWASAVTQSALLTPYALRRREQVAALWRGHRADVAAVAVLRPLAYLLVLYALRIAPVSVVAPARELSIVVGGVIAWRTLGEPGARRRMAGAVVVLVGIAVIASGA